MEPDADSFWFQPPTTRRRPQPTPLFNPVALILAIPIIALLLLFFVVPPFISHTNQILRPNSVKKSWDSLNILLVLFAIICGIFARRNDDAPPSDEAVAADDRRIPAAAPAASNFVDRPRPVPAWMDFPDRRDYNSISNANTTGSGGRLRRSSSSYPDLRQESLWESGGGNRSRFFDDFDVNFYRSPPPESFELRRRLGHEAERQEAETVVREIPVDKFEVRSTPPPPTPPKSPTPPPPPPPPPTLKRRRSLHSVPRTEIVDTRKVEAGVSQHGRQQPPPPPPAPPPPPTPPSPPAAAPEVQYPEEVSVKIHRKRSGTKEFATVIASLYKGQRKRKKRVRSRNIYDSAAENSAPPSAVEPQSAPPPPPPQPPPPPPPPSTVLQNLFKKSVKNKRVHSIPTTAAPPPPPPPPPPNSIFNNIFKTGSKSKRFAQSSVAPPPPPPPPPPSSILNSLFKTGTKSRRFKNVPTSPPPAPPPPPRPAAADPPRRRQLNTGKPPKPTKPAEHYQENVIIAPPSPLIPLPPPPPPFRMSEVKFVARGDFVRIRSTHSSRCSSPDLEDVDVMSVKSDGGDSIGPSISCPSPDVNVKADSFIARLRDEWRLEKMNSVREKRKSG